MPFDSESFRKIEEMRKNAEALQQRRMSAITRPPDSYPLPDIMDKLLAMKPLSLELHEASSAAALVLNLKARVDAWTQALPDHLQVAMYAMLSTGEQIRVSSVTAEGQNGIAIDSPDGCMVLLHQSSLQLLCVAEKIEDPSKGRSSIGFTAVLPRTQEGPQ